MTRMHAVPRISIVQLTMRASTRIFAAATIAGLVSGCAYQLPSFAMPGSGTPPPRTDLKPRKQMPDSQRLGGTDAAGLVGLSSGPGVPYTAPPQLVAKPGEKIVTIGPDDSLLSLSRAHGVPVTMLMSSNNLTNLTLEPGQQLRIPGLGSKR
jgi:LysM repeat protein